jgi:hypothetical protein
MVDIDARALQAKGLAALDVVNEVEAQNRILPTSECRKNAQLRARHGREWRAKAHREARCLAD